MSLYVISDLHLCREKPEITAALHRFCSRLQEGDRLLIAGDLFDFWVGWHRTDPLQRELAALTGQLRARGISCAFMCGNRDFLMSKRDAAKLGLKLLPESLTKECGGKKVLIIHGDELCSNDINFQKLKATSKNPLARVLFRLLPYRVRTAMALKVRRRSMDLAPSRLRDDQRYGLIKTTASALMQRHGCSILLHGHFHRCGRHENDPAPGLTRIDCGCWEQNLSWARFTDRGIELRVRPLGTAAADL